MMPLQSQLKEVKKRISEVKKTEAQVSKRYSIKQERRIKRLSKIRLGTYGAPARRSQRAKKIRWAKETIKERRELSPKLKKRREALIKYRKEIEGAISEREARESSWKIAVDVINDMIAGKKVRLGNLKPSVRKYVDELRKRENIRRAIIRTQKAQKSAWERGKIKRLKDFPKYVETARAFKRLGKAYRYRKKQSKKPNTFIDDVLRM